MRTFKIPYTLHAVAYIEAQDMDSAIEEMESGLTDTELVDCSEVESVDWSECEEVDEDYYLREYFEKLEKEN